METVSVVLLLIISYCCEYFTWYDNDMVTSFFWRGRVDQLWMISGKYFIWCQSYTHARELNICCESWMCSGNYFNCHERFLWFIKKIISTILKMLVFKKFLIVWVFLYVLLREGQTVFEKKNYTSIFFGSAVQNRQNCEGSNSNWWKIFFVFTVQWEMWPQALVRTRIGAFCEPIFRINITLVSR